MKHMTIGGLGQRHVIDQLQEACPVTMTPHVIRRLVERGYLDYIETPIGRIYTPESVERVRQMLINGDRPYRKNAIRVGGSRTTGGPVATR